MIKYSGGYHTMYVHTGAHATHILHSGTHTHTSATHIYTYRQHRKIRLTQKHGNALGKSHIHITHEYMHLDPHIHIHIHRCPNNKKGDSEDSRESKYNYIKKLGNF